MTSKDQTNRDIGSTFVGGISTLFTGLLNAFSRLFAINPRDFRKPGDRPNAPPPSGGVSSLD